MRASISIGLGPDRGRERRELLRVPGDHEGHRPGQDRGVRLRVGAAADPDQRLADHVVDGEHRRSRSRSRRGSSRGPAQPRSRSLGSWSSERGDQLGAAQGRHPGDRVGERRVERIGAVGEGVHRAGPQLRLGLAGHRVGIGDHQRRPDQATRPLSAPAGRRWMPGHLRPRHRGRDRGDAGAADRGDRLRGIDRRGRPRRRRGDAPDADTEQRGGGLGNTARGHLVDGARPRRPAPARPPAPAAVLSSSNRAKPCSRRSCGAWATPPARKTTVAPRVAPDEVAVHSRGGASRGFLTGRRFGSTSARRCS